MLPILKNLFRRQRVRPVSLMRQSRGSRPVVNPQFVSFLEKSGFRKRMLDRHAKNRQIKRFFAIAFGWALAFGFVYVVIESAQALQLF